MLGFWRTPSTVNVCKVFAARARGTTGSIALNLSGAQRLSMSMGFGLRLISPALTVRLVSHFAFETNIVLAEP